MAAITGLGLTWHPGDQLEGPEDAEGAEHGEVGPRRLPVLRLGHQQGKEPGGRRSEPALAGNFQTILYGD